MEAKTQRGFGHSRRRIAVELGLLVGGLVAVVLVAVWVASLLAATLVRFVPTSADQSVGEAVWGQVAPEELRCTDPSPLQYVERVAAPLLAELADDRFKWQFAVVDRPEINAFALPGGYVTVHYGLLRAVASGDELAAVLAHEIHHVTERHGMVRVLRDAGGRVILGLVLGWGDVATLARYGGSVVDLSYDRTQERDADRKGRALLMRAGIDPRALGSFFERVRQVQGDAPGGLRFLSSHPGHGARIEAAERDARGFQPTLQLPAPPTELRCR